MGRGRSLCLKSAAETGILNHGSKMSSVNHAKQHNLTQLHLGRVDSNLRVKRCGPWCPNLPWYQEVITSGAQAGRAEAVPLSPSACPARALLLGHAQPVHIFRTPTGVLSFTPAPPSHSRMLHITGNPWEGANQQHPAALLRSLLRTQALPGLGIARPDAWHVAQRGRKRLRYHCLSCSSSKYHSNK